MGKLVPYEGKRKVKILDANNDWIEDEIDYSTLQMVDALFQDWYFMEDTSWSPGWGYSTQVHCSPGMHDWKEKVTFHIPRWECHKCGLNLYFDQNEEAYRKFKEYEEKNPQLNWPWKPKKEDK